MTSEDDERLNHSKHMVENLSSKRCVVVDVSNIYESMVFRHEVDFFFCKYHRYGKIHEFCSGKVRCYQEYGDLLVEYAGSKDISRRCQVHEKMDNIMRLNKKYLTFSEVDYQEYLLCEIEGNYVLDAL